MKTLISVVGTTAIGKTSLAIALARQLKTDIISCDSRQFYREMKIGTATPSEQQLREAPHHFIGNLSVLDTYSIGQYETDALKKLEEIFQNHNTAIMVGGSMMYEKAVIEGLNDLPESNEEHQKILNEIWQKDGYGRLQSLLATADPQYFQTVDRENPRRILRALDVIWQTGRPYSEIISAPKKARGFQTIRIGIAAPREVIYQRINTRVEMMLEAGLLEEVTALRQYRDLVALKTVGYTELFNFLDGSWELDVAVEEIQKNSRRFAKRQLTWYRGEDNIHWVSFENPLEESLSLLKQLLTDIESDTSLN